MENNTAKTLYLRYRIDASRDLGSDRLHDASESVDQEWHDTEEEAIAYAEGLADEDDELILTVGEYAIEATSEPTDWDWNALRTRSPRREIEVEKVLFVKHTKSSMDYNS